ncbi:hypothetical protein E4U54_003915 [Claviceps lovelessii]|nr:hypothetical protein E4U54_003915 [Claviceps lovelessii]
MSSIFGTCAGWTGTDPIGKNSKWPDPETRDGTGRQEAHNLRRVRHQGRHQLRQPEAVDIQRPGKDHHLHHKQARVLQDRKTGSTNSSIGKRVIIYRMGKKLGRLRAFPPRNPSPTASGCSSSALALSVSNCYEKAPVSLEMALESEFKRSVNHVTAGLIMDPNATEFQCRTATAVMAIRVGVSIERLVGGSAAMSPRLVCEPEHELPFIIGIKTIKMNLKTV